MNETYETPRRNSPRPRTNTTQAPAIRVLVGADSKAAIHPAVEALQETEHAGSPARFDITAAVGEADLIAACADGPRPELAVLPCATDAGLTDAILRQMFLLRLFGVDRVLLAVTTSDCDDVSSHRFDAIAATFRAHADHVELSGAEAVSLTPPSNLRTRIDALFKREEQENDAGLRVRIETATALENHLWRCRGTVESGFAGPDEAITVFPAEKPGRIENPDSGDGATRLAATGRPVTFDVETEAHIGEGNLLAAGDTLPDVSDQIAAHLVWTAKQRLYPGRTYLLRLAGETVAATVTALKHRVDPRNLEPQAARFLDSGEIGFCNLALDRPIVFDRDPRLHATHRFRLLDRHGGHELAIGFPVYGLRRATNLTHQDIAIGNAARAAMKGQQPCVLWFTGLSGAGKSSAASAVDQQLHTLGHHTYLLDGDNVRHGLCRDLGFTEADRVENIRRVAEVARLMVDAGLIVLVSFISPFRSERRMARELFEDGQFFEIFMDTPLAVCEARDEKGLYRKARAGDLVNFTGIDSPYEPPENADISLRPEDGSAEAQAVTVVDSLRERGVI